MEHKLMAGSSLQCKILYNCISNGLVKISFVTRIDWLFNWLMCTFMKSELWIVLFSNDKYKIVCTFDDSISWSQMIKYSIISHRVTLKRTQRAHWCKCGFLI